MVDYVYSLSTNFPGGIAPSALFDEITASVGVLIDPTSIDVDGNVVTITFPIALSGAQQTALNAVVAAHTHICKSGIVFSTSFSDIISFGDTSANSSNKFLNTADNQVASNVVAPIAERAGSVVRISFNSDGTNSYYIDVVKNAFSGGAGTYSGGILIGSALKPAGVKFFRAVVNFPFLEGDIISCYIRSVTGGANKPLARLFFLYTD